MANEQRTGKKLLWVGALLAVILLALAYILYGSFGGPDEQVPFEGGESEIESYEDIDAVVPEGEEVDISTVDEDDN